MAIVEGAGRSPPNPAAPPLREASDSGPPPQADQLQIADPERALVVAYAPAADRGALAALFALDERLGTIVGTTTDPHIGLIRLAWWREALERLDGEEPPAEPLLQALAGLRAFGISGAALSGIEDGWAALLDDEVDDEAMSRHASARGATLFALAGLILRAEPDPRLASAGCGWALADLGHRHSAAAVRDRARASARAALDALPRSAWPNKLRPLGMLAALARADASLSGARRQGAPRRLLRMLALRLTGR